MYRYWYTLYMTRVIISPSHLELYLPGKANSSSSNRCIVIGIFFSQRGHSNSNSTSAQKGDKFSPFFRVSTRIKTVKKHFYTFPSGPSYGPLHARNRPRALLAIISALFLYKLIIGRSPRKQRLL